MKKTNATMLLMALTLVSSNVMARDDVLDFSIAEAMATPKISNAIGEGITFYFGNQKHGKVTKQIGNFSTNKKTNAFGKSDKEACDWVFASAMKTLKQRAVKEGGNAIINIKSNYKGNLTSSDTEYQCGAGSVIAGVALTGDVVILAE